MLKNIVQGIVVAVTVSLLAVVGNAAFNGGLVRLMGGITKDELQAYGVIPVGTVIAFDLGGKCPPNWRQLVELKGRMIIGAGTGKNLTSRDFRAPGGAEAVALSVENLPPHTHRVYDNAGVPVRIEAPGPNEETAAGAGSEDSQRVVYGRTGFTGGMADGVKPLDIMPPYLALTYCRKD
jgi:microcystin-dependent protein